MKIVIDIPEEQIKKSLEESKHIHEDEGEKGFVDIMMLYTNGQLDFVDVSRKTDFYSCKYKILQKGDGDLISRKAVLDCIGMTSLHYDLARRLRKLPTIPQTDSVLEDIKRDIEKLPRIKVGNSNSPTVKYYIDERLIYEVFEKHIALKNEQTDVDLISRTDLLKDIADLKQSPWFNDGKDFLIDNYGVADLFRYNSYVARKEAIEIVEDLYIKKLPSAKETAKWIPVSERLPEDGDYLVTIKSIDGALRIDMRSFAKDLNKVDKFDFPKHKCGWYDYDIEYGYWEDTKVIAWMPLLEPYKESEEEKE